MNTGKRTTFTQCIEHLGKHCTIRNSAHGKPSTVFFNSSSGTTIAEAVNVQNISIFGICKDVRHFAQHSYNVSINIHNGQLTLHTDSHASCSGAVRQEGRTLLGAKSELLYSEIARSQKLFGIGHMYIYTFLLRMTNTMTFRPGTPCVCVCVCVCVYTHTFIFLMYTNFMPKIVQNVYYSFGLDPAAFAIYKTIMNSYCFVYFPRNLFAILT